MPKRDFSSLFDAALGLRDVTLDGVLPIEKEIITKLREMGENYEAITDIITEVIYNVSAQRSAYMYSICDEANTMLTEYEDYLGNSSVTAADNDQHAVLQVGQYVWGSEWPVKLAYLRTMLEYLSGVGPTESHTRLSELNYLHDKAHQNQGDPVLQEATHRLFSAAYAVFVRSLSIWMLNGDIFDPTGDFYIVRADTNAIADDNAKTVTDATRRRPAEMHRAAAVVVKRSIWWSGWAEVPEAVPTFCSRACLDKIMFIGKTANLIRTAGTSLDLQLDERSLTIEGLGERLTALCAAAPFPGGEFEQLINQLRPQVDNLLWGFLMTRGFLAMFDQVTQRYFVMCDDTIMKVPAPHHMIFTDETLALYKGLGKTIKTIKSTIDRLDQTHRGLRQISLQPGIAMQVADMRIGLTSLACYYHHVVDSQISILRKRLHSCRNYEDAFKWHSMFLATLQARLFGGERSKLSESVVKPLIGVADKCIIVIERLIQLQITQGDRRSAEYITSIERIRGDLKRHAMTYDNCVGMLATSVAHLNSEVSHVNVHMAQLNAMLTFNHGYNTRRLQRASELIDHKTPEFR